MYDFFHREVFNEDFYDVRDTYVDIKLGRKGLVKILFLAELYRQSFSAIICLPDQEKNLSSS